MDDSSVVGVLAEALAQHVPNMRGECDACAEPVHRPGALARHQASVVAALPNIRIVDLVAERAEAASRDARRHLSEMRCINGVAGYYCNVTYAERDQYYCEYAAKGLTHYFDTPEHIAELEARAAGGQA